MMRSPNATNFLPDFSNCQAIEPAVWPGMRIPRTFRPARSRSVSAVGRGSGGAGGGRGGAGVLGEAGVGRDRRVQAVAGVLGDVVLEGVGHFVAANELRAGDDAPEVG